MGGGASVAKTMGGSKRSERESYIRVLVCSLWCISCSSSFLIASFSLAASFFSGLGGRGGEAVAGNRSRARKCLPVGVKDRVTDVVKAVSEFRVDGAVLGEGSISYTFECGDTGRG